jgi:hypothetical protein
MIQWIDLIKIVLYRKVQIAYYQKREGSVTLFFRRRRVTTIRKAFSICAGK